jgi:hypothetical protein
VPSKLEIAVFQRKDASKFSQTMSAYIYPPRLDYNTIRAVPVLATESIVVQIAYRPSIIRSWSGALEWLLELAAELNKGNLLRELTDRPGATVARTGYFLQGMRPDLADAIYSQFPIVNKTWFGPRAVLRNHDNHWLVADTILPFDPRELDDVR